MILHGTLILKAALISATLLMAQQGASPDAATPATAAKRFLSSLDEPQKAKAVFAYNSSTRTTWQFTPGNREGIALKDLTPRQREFATGLLRSALATPGLKREAAIRTLEGVLRDLEGPHRDPEYYLFAIFGTPSEKGAWGWRYEGHHMSLHFAYRDGKVVSTTPQFFGSNPAEVQSGPHKGMRALAAEEDLAWDLLNSLSEPQKKLAVLSEKAPADIATSNTRKAAIQEDLGLSHADMTTEQRSRLKALVSTYASVQADEGFKHRMAGIEKAGWSKVKFAWLGSTVKGKGWYYRVQGPTFLIECDDTQNNANHIHSVWRDFEGDFGPDALAEHYQTSPHHRHLHAGSKRPRN